MRVWTVTEHLTGGWLLSDLSYRLQTPRREEEGKRLLALCTERLDSQRASEFLQSKKAKGRERTGWREFG